MAVSRVYSERFIYTTLEWQWVMYGVPPQHRAVLRCLTMVNVAADTAHFSLQVAGSHVFYSELPGFSSRVLGDFRVPIYAYEQVGIFIEGTTCMATVSGYLFDDPGNGRAPATESIEGDPLAPPPAVMPPLG
jgi:hypothetical protein